MLTHGAIYSRFTFASTVNPRINPLGVYLFLIFSVGGLFEGGVLCEGGLMRGGTYKIIVDIKKALLKDPVYFRRNFFMSIKLIVTKSMKFCGNSIKRQRQPQIAKIIKLRGPIRWGEAYSGGGGGLLTICSSRMGAYSGGVIMGGGGAIRGFTVLISFRDQKRQEFSLALIDVL